MRPTTMAHMVRRLALTGGVLAASAHVASGQPASPAGTARSLEAVSDRMYAAREGDRSAAVLVDDSGIVVIDPLNRAFAGWLHEELDRRFPGRAVKFVVYSGNNFGRVGGAGEFKDTATIVAHKAFGASLVNDHGKLPPELRALDRNGNSRLEASELAGQGGAPLVEHDVNHDGVVTAGELQHDVAVPKQTFLTRETLTVGTAAVELVHAAGDAASDVTLVRFPSERTVFTGGGPDLGAAPFSFGSLAPLDVQRWVRSVRALDFDTLLTGRGERLTRAEFERVAAYVDELVAGVVRSYGHGLTLAEIQASDLLALHQGEPHYAGRATQIAAVYTRLHRLRATFTGSLLSGVISGNAGYCEGFSNCSTASRTASALAGLAVTLDQIGLSLELGLHNQLLASRESGPLDDAFAYRVTRQSLLFTYRASKGDGMGLSVVVGPSLLVGDTDGISRVKDTLLPAGGRHRFTAHERNIGVTGGVDFEIPVRRAFTLTIPVRLTRDNGRLNDRRLGQLSVEGGVGLRFMMKQLGR